jgi:hypothetical protein
MITRFLTEVRLSFNPFSLRSKPARLFLSLIPPNARADGMKIDSKMLPRESKEPARLAVKFSTSGHTCLKEDTEEVESGGDDIHCEAGLMCAQRMARR